MKKTKSGVTVNHDTALNFSAVWACTRILTGAISPLPFQIFRKTDKGRELVRDHYLYNLISRKPNPLMTKTVYLDRKINHLALQGNAYSEIVTNNSGRITQFRQHHPKNVEVKRDGDKVIYEVTERDGKTRIVRAENMIHIPGLGDDIVGKSVIQYAREDIGLGIVSKDFSNEFFEDGGALDGYLSTDSSLHPTQIESIKENWVKSKKGKHGGSGTALLQGGVRFTPLSIPYEDAKFLSTRKFQVTEIARWFGVPPDKIADLERATFNNIEHLSISFLQDTISPIVAKIENEYTNKIFSATEPDLYVEFNMDAYLRADSKAKSEIYRTYIQNGIMTPNEVRQKENMNTVEGGDDLFIQQNMMPLRIAEEILRGKSGGGANEGL